MDVFHDEVTLGCHFLCLLGIKLSIDVIFMDLVLFHYKLSVLVMCLSHWNNMVLHRLFQNFL